MDSTNFSNFKNYTTSYNDNLNNSTNLFSNIGFTEQMVFLSISALCMLTVFIILCYILYISFSKRYNSTDDKIEIVEYERICDNN